MTQEIKEPKQIEIEAQAVYQAEGYLEAAELFLAAATGFLAQGDNLAAAEMQNNACVSWIQVDEYQKAFDALDNSEQVFLDAGDPVRYAMALGNRAAAYEGLWRLEDAVQLYSESAEILRNEGKDTAYTQVMQSISAIQLRTGKSFEALASMQSAMDHVEKPGIRQRLIKRLLKLPNQFLGK